MQQDTVEDRTSLADIFRFSVNSGSHITQYVTKSVTLFNTTEAQEGQFYMAACTNLNLWRYIPYYSCKSYYKLFILTLNWCLKHYKTLKDT